MGAGKLDGKVAVSAIVIPCGSRALRGVGRRCAVFLATVVLSGCIVIPIPIREDPPYRVGDNLELTCGTTKREDVLQSLGEPAVRYCDGREFVYVGFQQTLLLPYVGVLPMGPIPIPFGGQTRIGKEHLLKVQFDESGVLRAYELAIPKAKSWMGTFKCTPTEVCVHEGGAFRSASSEVDEQAKRFEPVPGHCAVYFYSEGFHNGVRIDGQEAAPIVPPDTFLWVALAPSTHSFTVTAAPAPLDMEPERGASFRAAFGPQTTLQIDCQPGGLVFLRPRLRDEDPRKTSERLLYGPMDSVVGQRRIAERRLIMASDPWGAASCGSVPRR